MVNHGAFEPTKMCRLGRIGGTSTSVPMATCTTAPSRTTENSSEPQRAAVHVVGVVVAVEHEPVRALGDGELLARDAGERLEGRAGRRAGSSSSGSQRVEEGVGDGVVNGAAEACSGQGLGHR